MDKFWDFVTNKIISILVTCIGFIIPGILTLFLFKRDVFLQLDFIMNIILSISITMPSYFVIMVGKLIQLLLVDNFASKDQLNIIYEVFATPLIYNFFIFLFALLCFYDKRVIKYFVYMIIIMSSLISIAAILGGVLSLIKARKKK